MKKALLATTALVLSAGVAAADVTISGYGRTGIIYYEDAVGLDGTKETQVISRLRMNLNATTETDAGVEFGGQIRLQFDQNQGNATDGRGRGADTYASKIWISAQGLTVEIGNVDVGYDSAALKADTELGVYDRSVGFSDVAGDSFAYTDYGPNPDRVGVAAVYSFGDLNVRASMVNPDQTIDVPGAKKEYSVAVDYTWNDQLELSAAFAKNALGVDGEDLFFVGARYAVQENARIGLNYADASDQTGTLVSAVGTTTAVTGSKGKTLALYGDYTLADGLTNIEAYVAHNDQDLRPTKNAYGIGVNYDLGGARLGASVQRDYEKRTTADMGVRFNF